MAELVDPARCPLCGGRNDCALADPARGSACADCWCSQVTFDRELLQCVPDSAAGKACICRNCATRPDRPSAEPPWNSNSPRA
ncbi:MAG: cysteine-rich CWC family protein [Planctomycetes bacterium]|nr:cysteine-rich CWC family protein [Planctomycetota bacterium]